MRRVPGSLAAAAAAAAALVVLGACSAPVDRAEVAAWLAALEESADGYAGGGWTAVPAEAPAGSDMGTMAPFVTQTYDAPIEFAGVDALCFGGGRITVVIDVARSAGSAFEQTEVPCGGEPHPLVDARTDVVSLSFGGYAPESAATTWAVVVNGS